MSIKTVKTYLKDFGREKDVLEFDVSSATVELAAQALHVDAAMIAKTMSFHGKETSDCILIVTAGDVKIDNSKFKQVFGFKAKMLNTEEVSHLTGYEIGGVCPFANPSLVTTYLDDSLRRFPVIYPACGSSNSAIKLTCGELEQYSQAQGWINVCKLKEVLVN